MQQLARWKQTHGGLEGAATGVLEPPALSAHTQTTAPAEGDACPVDDSGMLRVDRCLPTGKALSRRLALEDGFRLPPIRQGSLLASVGFKSGDISVSGQSLMSMGDAMALYRDLKAETPLTISIHRLGQQMLLHFMVK